MSDYRELKAWREAVTLCGEVHMITKMLPISEQRALISQMNRSSLSIVSNIVEGSKKSLKTYIYQLTIAHASAAELDAQLQVTAMLGLANSEIVQRVRDKTDHVSRLVFLLRRSLRNLLPT